MRAVTTLSALNGTSELLQRILDATRECVLVVDGELRISHANVPAAVTFGQDALDVEGSRLSEIIRDLDLHEAFRIAIQRQSASDVRLALSRTGQRKFDVHVAPMVIDDRPHAIGFFYETTQIDRLESVRQEFLSNISHELRTPLTSILAFVETLEDGALDDRETAQRFLGVIRRNAERMHTLIADILELSLIESGNVSIELREVDLHKTVDNVIGELAARAKERNVRLINEVPFGLTIRADHVRLEQMLTNLIDNGIKFNRKDGSVSVGNESAGTRDVISVTDTGEGILPEHASRIFERFYRVDKARSRDMGGTGLGLAIVKHLAKLHGGEVTLDSDLGKGTTFRIELPRQA